VLAHNLDSNCSCKKQQLQGRRACTDLAQCSSQWAGGRGGSSARVLAADGGDERGVGGGLVLTRWHERYAPLRALLWLDARERAAPLAVAVGPQVLLRVLAVRKPRKACSACARKRPRGMNLHSKSRRGRVPTCLKNVPTQYVSCCYVVQL